MVNEILNHNAVASQPPPKRPLPCLVTLRVSSPCAECSRPVDGAHMPHEDLRIYCARCCPRCKLAAGASKS